LRTVTATKVGPPEDTDHTLAAAALLLPAGVLFGTALVNPASWPLLVATAGIAVVLATAILAIP
jgi:hypothetical protein